MATEGNTPTEAEPANWSGGDPLYTRPAVLPPPSPNITLGQLVGAATLIIGQAVAYGLIDSETAQHAIAVATRDLGVAWIAGDTLLRGFRNIRHGLINKA